MENQIKKSGEVALVLRSSHADGSSISPYADGFKWPKEVGTKVTAPDWDQSPVCGNGLHGFLDGEGAGSNACWDADALWYVLEVEKDKLVHLDGKVKFPACVVACVGTLEDAIKLLRDRGVTGPIIGDKVLTGNRGTATAGYAGTATAGYAGTATAGNRGTATAGNAGTATAGDAGTATAGDAGTATAGNRGTATAGEKGIISLSYWDSKVGRQRAVIGYVGEGGIEPRSVYRLDEVTHQFEKVQ